MKTGQEAKLEGTKEGKSRVLSQQRVRTGRRSASHTRDPGEARSRRVGQEARIGGGGPGREVRHAHG